MLENRRFEKFTEEEVQELRDKMKDDLEIGKNLNTIDDEQLFVYFLDVFEELQSRQHNAFFAPGFLRSLRRKFFEV